MLHGIICTESPGTQDGKNIRAGLRAHEKTAGTGSFFMASGLVFIYREAGRLLGLGMAGFI